MRLLFREWRHFLSDNNMDTIRVAKIVLYKDDSVLLLRSAGGAFKGEWDLPGGHIEEGESYEEGLKREVREETGLVLNNVESLNFVHGHKMFFKGQLPNSKIELSNEHDKYIIMSLKEADSAELASYFKEAIKRSLKRNETII